MKFLKSYIPAMLAMCATMTFTACDDDDVDVVGKEFDAPGAYFQFQYVNEVELDVVDTQFTIPVNRENGEGTATVNLSHDVTSAGANAATAFNIPATVTFADGETTTLIPVTFDINDLTPLEPYKIEVSITDGHDTPYTSNTVTYEATFIPWEDLGACEYTDFLIGTFFNIPDVTWDVQIKEHPQKKGLYRLINPYQNVPIGGLIYDDSEEHYMYINATDPEAVFISDKDGNPTYYYSGVMANPNYGQFICTSEASYYLMRGDSDAAADYYGSMRNGRIYIPALLVAMELYQDGGLFERTIEEGQYMIVLPGAPELVESWTVLGQGAYTDGFICGAFEDMPDNTYNVQVEQCEEDPGLIRILNPYTAAFPYGKATDQDIYITFDVTDPQCVYVPLQATGFSTEEDGEFEIINLAQYLKLSGASSNDIIQRGFNDTFEGNVITIAATHCAFTLPKFDGEDYGPYGTDSEARLVLTAAMSESIMNAVAAKAAPGIARRVKKAEKLLVPSDLVKTNEFSRMGSKLIWK